MAHLLYLQQQQADPRDRHASILNIIPHPEEKSPFDGQPSAQAQVCYVPSTRSWPGALWLCQGLLHFLRSAADVPVG